MFQPVQDGVRSYFGVRSGACFDWASGGSVLSQSQVGAPLIVVRNILFHDAFALRRRENQDPIEDFAAKSADQSFNYAVLPWRARRGLFSRYMVLLQYFADCRGFKDRGSVGNKCSWGTVRSEGEAQLLRYPWTRRMIGGGEVNDVSSREVLDDETVLRTDEAIQLNKKVHGPGVRSQAAKDLLP